ncbi:SDR family oxidoreductase [Kribbia dieselivorans]|uniref:SDR family oxidoreductase n=1 Tax=Kribbia dieselivorans TaxID=331526 RepID=UPI0008395097|nr:SDR family NAD(P)-dependent oxidoreductase [Kribbia dieselivorans]
MSDARVAVVTGGATGIGAAIALRLAQDGHAVAVNYAHSEAAADQLVHQIKATGGRAISVQADVSDASQAARLIDRAAEGLGAPPTILINNAGLFRPGSARRMPPAAWDQIIGVNLNGAFYCTHAVLPAMYENGWGRVVFLGSPSGGRAISPGTSAYAAAKAGLVALTQVLAIEAAGRGVTVNTVIPGFVDTAMTQDGDRENTLANAWPQIPPSAIADTIAHLVSDRAAYVSGEQVGVWLGGPGMTA